VKIELEDKDLAELFNPDCLGMGARIAARAAVEKVIKLPWKPTDTYIDAVLEAISKFYAEGVKNG
jgi:hypothetical protein